MNLLSLRTEALNHGFDPIQFSSRMNQYINDAQSEACSRADFYADEATQDFSTVAGTTSYSQPANFAKDRSLRFVGTTFTGELQAVGLRTIDRAVSTSGIPTCYAIDGANIHLYPTPDTAYTLELRYWAMPPDLVNDTDTPTTIPVRHHKMLWYYAVAEAYAAEDDIQGGGAAAYWTQRFETALAKFAADVKFPNSDTPTQIADMWKGPPVAGTRSWTRSSDFG